MKKMIIPIAILILLIVATRTYSILTSSIGGESNLPLARWNIAVNTVDITSAYQNVLNINQFTWVNSHANNNTVAPGSTGSFQLVIDPSNSDVAVRYDLTYVDHILDADKVLTVTGITVNDDSLVRTGEYTYTGLFSLAEIESATTKTVTVNVAWVNDEDNNITDSDIGLGVEQAQYLELNFNATQYQGATIVPYE